MEKIFLISAMEDMGCMKLCDLAIVVYYMTVWNELYNGKG